MVEPSLPSAPEIPSPGLAAKFGMLWLTNKPLAIFLIILFILLILGIIFAVVWFLVIAPKRAATKNSSTPASTPVSPTPVAHLTSSLIRSHVLSTGVSPQQHSLQMTHQGDDEE